MKKSEILRAPQTVLLWRLDINYYFITGQGLGAYGEGGTYTGGMGAELPAGPLVRGSGRLKLNAFCIITT